MSNRIPEASIPMGGIAVARDGERLRMLVGSCIGLALFDRRRKLVGMAHIVLPRSNGRVELPGKYADTAAPALIERLQRLAPGESLKLGAKLAGGANMFGGTGAANQIGAENQKAVEKILDELRIPIVGRHCGGDRGRRLTLEAATGAFRIEIAGELSVPI